jgi:peroxiredoxin
MRAMGGPLMSRRRRKPTLPSSTRRDTQSGEHQTQQRVARRLRRPTKTHTARRPRTASSRLPLRARGAHHDHELDPQLELGVGETDGLARIDEVVFVGPRTTTCSAPSAPVADLQRERAVASRLRHKQLPSLELEWMPGERLDVQSLGSKPLVLYCHPGIEPGTAVSEGEEDEQAVGADAAECRSFAERELELASMNHRVVGVSSQSAASQLDLATQEALPHVMLSDDRLELAEEMGLPTFEVDGVRLYERVTLIVRDGRVQKVFYPILDPAAHATEVAEWLREDEAASPG